MQPEAKLCYNSSDSGISDSTCVCALNCRLLCTFNYSFDGNNTTFVLKTSNKIETAAQLLAESGNGKGEREVGRAMPKGLKLSEMQYAPSESVVVCLWVFKCVCCA